MISPPFTIQMLGSLAVRDSQGNIRRFRTRRTEELFAFLAYHPGHAHSRDMLAETFWPDAPYPQRAQKSLAVALSSLRTQMKNGPTDSEDSVLQIRGRAVLLEPTALTTDVTRFESLLDVAKRSTEASTARSRYAEAVGSYSGSFLEGIYSDWILPERERLRRRLKEALVHLAQYAEAEQDFGQAISHYRQAVWNDMGDSALVIRLLTLLRTQGRESEAVRLFHEIEVCLHEELGEVVPLSVRQAINDLLDHAAPPSHPTRTRSRRQLAPKQETLPYRSTSPAAAPLSTFFGRAREMATIRQAMERDNCRLMTLTGGGGMGKTRLATELMERWRGDGYAIYFVSASKIADSEQFYREIARAMGLPLDDTLTPVSCRDAIIRALNVVTSLSLRRAILVLDEFEYLMPEGDAPAMLAALLAKAPALTCLITSRQRTGIVGEHLITLEPLPIPQHGEHLSAEQMETLWPSVALFVDRAQLIQPDFHLSQRNAGAVAELVAGLEGIPLAIELAASRVRVLTVQQMRERIQHRLNFLQDEHRPGARHASLRHSFEWSINLLTEEQRFFLKELCVFRGDFTLKAAEIITGEAKAIEILSQLCDVSLLTPYTHGKTMHFRMLDSLRLFLMESLSSAEHSGTA